MGDVFVAIDTKLGQQVALKILKSNWAETDELRRRFEHEATLCAALRGDHIVPVSDYGVTSEGYPFYVMEYLKGQTLGQLMRREKRLPIDRAIKLIIQVCDGLEPAHQGVMLHQRSERIKVVHRDLKPENIFLVNTALGELVKILDFGIAKIHYEQSDSTVQTGMFIGTFHYASPEQIEVRQEIDHRSDIYSLGIILYEMLAGTDPFGLGIESQDISQMSWAIAHASRSPIPLRSQPHCETLPPALEEIVMRCLEKHPNRRFATVGELRQALCSLASQVQNQPTEETLAQAIPSTVTPAQVSARTSSDSPILEGRTEVAAPAVVRSQAPKRSSPIKLLLLGFGGAIAISISYWAITQHPPSQQAETTKPSSTPKAADSTPLLNTATEQAKAGKLADAIATAAQIPATDPIFSEAQSRINQWSEQLLPITEKELRTTNAQTALKDALTKIQVIPKTSLVYARAKTKQEQWRTEWQTAERQIKQAKEAEATNQWSQVLDATAKMPPIEFWQKQARSLKQQAEIAQKKEPATSVYAPPAITDPPQNSISPVDLAPPASSSRREEPAPAPAPVNPAPPPQAKPQAPKPVVIPPSEGKY